MIPQQLKTKVKNTLLKIAKARPNSKYVSPSNPSQAEIDEFISKQQSIGLLNSRRPTTEFEQALQEAITEISF